MREIVLDTETTGLDPAAGHRIVEIACLELKNHVPSGTRYQTYVNPERDVPDDARRVHGLDADFLSGHPRFGEVADELLDFLADAPLVIHNAEFDLRFLNHELSLAERPVIDSARAVDTLALARWRFPGAQVSLDALCKRFEIDNSAREVHGALLDCELLAAVYLELRGGRQPGFELGREERAAAAAAGARPQRPPRPHAPSEAERAAHAALRAKLTDPIWDQ